MVPRYVRIKKLPAKHKQPHVSEGLRGGGAAGQQDSGVAAASSSRGLPVAGRPIQGQGGRKAGTMAQEEAQVWQSAR